MGWRIIDMDCPSSNLWVQPIFFFVFICLHHFALGATNLTDVAAINSLYAALGSPNIPGWVSAAGDPCGDAWQGVLCDTTNNIISITLINNNLGGELGNSLGSFSSIQSIDLSKNHIGGNIPSTLPISLKTLDLAGNNMSGELPPSMENLSALSIIHLQNNQLSGTLDVLQNLPLQELNIENNLFSGSIPDKLLTIPSFKSAGNNFSTSAAPLASPPESSAGNNFSTSAAPVVSPPAPSMQLSPFFQGPPTKSPPQSGSSSSSGTASGSRQTPGRQAVPPSAVQEPNTQKKTQSSKTKRIVGISIASVIGFIIFILALLLCMPWCFSRSKEYYRTTTRHEVQPYVGTRDNPIDYGSFSQLDNHVEKAQKNAVVDIKDEHQAPVRRIAAVPKLKTEEGLYSQRSTMPLRNLDRDMSFSDIDFMMSPPPPHPFLSEKVIVNPIRSEDTDPRPSTRSLPLTSVRSFPVASLQEYTNSFSQDNLLGSGMLGTVYHAELPNGKLSAIKKFDKGIANRLKDHEFLELVNTIDRIRHVNVVELMGYCSEHGQRLLIYEYCSNGTLDDALHQDDEYRKRLSWNKRTQMALGAARALEYLHEVCEPAVVHRNFKSANILLDDELNVQVSDCGLATLIASKSVSQLSGHLLSAYGYGAPEFESGIYTTQSDVYSFGVVMLELLTGRMSYDRTRTRGEQILVRWAVPQLYDIDALQRMVDPSLNGEYPIKSLSHFADIISRCVQTEPGFRPLMSEVVQDLQYLLLRGSP